MVDKSSSVLESRASPVLWPINKYMFEYFFTSHSWLHQSLIQFSIVLSWEPVNQAWELLGSYKVGRHDLSIPKAFVETSLSILWLKHYGQDAHPNTTHLLMSF